MIDLGSRRRIFPLALIFLCVIGMAGCQGFSTARNSTTSNNSLGTGDTAQLSASASNIDFGAVQLGKNETRSATLTNSTSSAIAIAQAAVSGEGFSVNAPIAPLVLMAGQSIVFSVTFRPKRAGASSGNLRITRTEPNRVIDIALSGSGAQAGALVTNPGSLDFGQVQVGASSGASLILTNSGGRPVTVWQTKFTGAAFHPSGLTIPLTLRAGQRVTFSVSFSPLAPGIASGNLAIHSNAENSVLDVPLTGTAVTPGLLRADPGTINFGSVVVGSTIKQPITLQNSGGSSITITAATPTGRGLSLSGLSLPRTLNAGQTASFTVAFSPQAAGAVTGNIKLASTASDSTLTIPLTGTGMIAGSLTPGASSISFGSVPVGAIQTRSETLTNTGGSAVTISQANISGTGFSLSGLSTPLTLSAGQSTTFAIKFSPVSSVGATGNLSINSNGSNPLLTVTLSGSGTVSNSIAGQLSITPSSISFGNVVVGTSQSRSATITASTAAVTVSSISGFSGSEFSLSGLTLPITIAAGSSVSFTATFRPQASGSTSVNASFTSNASNSPATQLLSGSGTTAVQHNVDLSWAASTSAVVGYNVYRGTQSGGPYSKINSVLLAPTNYIDSTVQGGQTYYYVVTAVDSQSIESGYSNQSKAVIPYP